MRRTKEQAIETREKLLDAALDVFLAKGYSAATLQDIADFANLTRGAVYWHFKGKEDIYRELYERVHRLDMAVFDGVADLDLAPFEKLRELVHAIVRNIYLNERYSDYLELTTFKIEYSEFEAINREKTDTYGYAVAVMESLAQGAIEEGVIADKVPPAQVAKTLLLFIIGVCRLKFTAPDLYATADDTLAIVDNYLDSLT
ncbi:MAG: TetR family transcriptional regulator [Acidobacteriota bacterium]|nr:MAG: TetR family transcriptional regulator [Acidobacteriota bacterium]